MMSKLRKSFRRKLSYRRDDSRHQGDGDNADRRSNTGTLRSQSVRSSRTSLASSCVSERRSPNPDMQWQRSTPSVIESNRVMLERQVNCDVVFVVGEKQALVNAHRFVLVSRSDVFLRMFCGPLAETRPVIIPDVTEQIFRQFLQFLYTDEVFLSPDNVTPLHYLARKYDVEPLVQQCLEFLHARLTCDNACSILEQAHCFDEHELYKASLQFVVHNAKACLASVAVNDLCCNCLERLLSVDDLEVNEQLLFKAALSWAEASLEKKQMTVDSHNVRKELGSLLYLIRFPAMTLEMLRERVFPTEVLVPEEKKAVVEYKERGRSSAEPFIGRGRQRVLRRFQNTSRVKCSNQSEASKWTAAITFSCDRDFVLHAIHVFACTRESQQVNLCFSIMEGPDEVDLYNRMTDYNHTYVVNGHVEGVKTLTIPISPSRPLAAHVHYTLVLQANMAACYAGTDGMASVTSDDVTICFRDAPVKMNGTTVSEGQIPSFVYSVR